MSCSQEVFTLRREKKHQEALALARKCVREDPNDEWNKKALAWSIFDNLKACVAERDYDEGKHLLQEFDELGIPEDDDVMHENINRLRAQFNPERETVVRAREASKDGDRQEALRLYRLAVRELPDDVEAKKGLGWEVWRSMSELARRDPPPIPEIERLAREFARLDIRSDATADLYCRVLNDITRVAEGWRGYPGFVRWWGPSNLRAEDFENQRGRDGKEYSSLATKVASALAKTVVDRGAREEVKWVVKFLDTVISRVDEEFWLLYYKGKLLLLDERYEEARDYIVPVVRAKMTESWAWGILGETYRGEAPEQSIACFCEAIRRSRDDVYVLNVRTQLAKLLAAQGEHAAAKREVELVLEVKHRQGYKVTPEVQQLTEEPWYGSTTAVAGNEALYEEHGEQAEALLLDALPWVDALVTGHQPASDRGPARTFIGVLAEGALEEVPVKDHHVKEVGGLEVGSPVRVKADAQGGNLSVYSVEPRDGEPWDLLPEVVAVIDHVNSGKQVSHFVISRSRTGLAYHDQVDGVDALPEGTSVAIRTLATVKGRPEKVVTARETDRETPSEIVQPLTGTFQFPYDGRTHFGFVNDYYVGEHLISRHGLSDGDRVRGAVVFDPDKGKWKALKIDGVGERSSDEPPDDEIDVDFEL